MQVLIPYGYNKKLGGNQAAADAMKAALARTSPILTAWEHVNIQYLTADLGVDKAQIPEWKGSDYDTCYVLTFDAATMALTDFRIAAENYQPPLL